LAVIAAGLNDYSLRFDEMHDIAGDMSFVTVT
jgi:hypothetical protein